MEDLKNLHSLILNWFTTVQNIVPFFFPFHYLYAMKDEV